MMSLASRHAPAPSGTTHAILPPAAVVTGQAAALPGAHGLLNQVNNTRGGNNSLMSLISSGLSIPRRMMVQARGAQDNLYVPIHLSFIGTIGQGTFGQIEQATLTVHNEPSAEQGSGLKLQRPGEQSPLKVAVKRVLQDPRYKNRELSIMQRLNNHPNVVKFYYYYYSTSSSSSRTHRSSSGRSGSSSSGVDVYLHLVLECFPESLCELIYRHLQRNVKIPSHVVKVFTYQMLKALAYLHSHQICHRDIKSSNLLVDESTLVLKVCDFGSAKEMVPGTANVSYISSRYYRAPELLFGAQLYTCAIDTWSGGCVLAEMLRQHCLFMGVDSVDQLVKVIRVLGTPSVEDIASMNPMYGSYNFPDVQSCPVKLFFPQHTPSDLLALMSKMLVYNPTRRISPANALAESCFDELREIGPNGLLPGRVRIPPHLFDPDPPPIPVAANNSTEIAATSHAPNQPNNWSHTDVRAWQTSNKKSGDIPSIDRKNSNGGSKHPSRELTAEMNKKGRQSTEKIAGSATLSNNLGPGCEQSETDVLCNNPVVRTSGSNSSNPGAANRTTSAKRTSNNCSKKSDSPASQPDYAALSNGSSERRGSNTTTATAATTTNPHQAFKSNPTSDSLPVPHTSESEVLNDVSS
ncbi:hypothetical protein T265_11420 [Opisthorchis viverrini]|uniref:Protein kinase domain-containing protein n=1 Tax=Opisthorchis viverrini TaxID=6198 RepID=A0A074YYP3_OPIVI|nr:hypothetical protein T265_11420 [Opisthorchis viverrini]KER19916.1 hypothetical protein T265_11420 [Opisthorchis viverrini]